MQFDQLPATKLVFSRLASVIVRVLLLAASVALIFPAGSWAVRPFLRPPQGLHPTGWTYAQLIRDRYPKHLIDPAWLGNDIYWTLSETAARLNVVLIGLVCIILLWRALRQERNRAN